MSQISRKCDDCNGDLNGWGWTYCKLCYLKRHPDEKPSKVNPEYPKAEELWQWIQDIEGEPIEEPLLKRKIDELMEFLNDLECLTIRGKLLARDIWEKWIKEDELRSLTNQPKTNKEATK